MWFKKLKEKNTSVLEEKCKHKYPIDIETKFIRSYIYLPYNNSLRNTLLVFQKVCSECYLYFRAEEEFNPDSIRHNELREKEKLNVKNRRK